MVRRNETTEYLLCLLRNAVFDVPLPADFSPSEDAWREVRALARRHDLAHLIEYSAQKNGLKTAFGTEHMDHAAYRYVQRCHAVSELFRTFGEEKIPFIPLKGAVIETLYPEPWMRTSSDVDVLLRSEDTERCAAQLTGQRGYRRGVTAAHDVQLLTPEGVSIELHHMLLQPGRLPKTEEILSHAWEVAVPNGCQGMAYALPEEYAYLYAIAHMLKHFQSGGCGIRSLLDLRLLLQREEHDDAACKALLDRCGMQTFASAMERLAEAWFGTGSAQGLESIERYIISGGVYGTVRNSVAVQQEEMGSAGYLLRRFFPPYGFMKNEYPILETCRVLLPYAWLCRMLRLCRGSVRTRVLREYRLSRKVDAARLDEISEMMKMLKIEAKDL